MSLILFTHNLLLMFKFTPKISNEITLHATFTTMIALSVSVIQKVRLIVDVTI